MRAARALAAALDLLLPAGCLACGVWIPEGVAHSLLCARCRSRLPVAPRPRCRRCDAPLGTGRVVADGCRECAGWPATLARARHAHVLAPPADALVHALKYEGWPELGGEMGRAMARVVAPPPDAVVVAVPTTAARLRRRGYNQADRLAEGVAESLGLPMAHALLRGSGGRTQVALHPSQRWANVRGAFAASPNAFRALAGRPVVLVDDVLTTGATAAAASFALREEAGAGEVTLLTYARALPKRDDEAR